MSTMIGRLHVSTCTINIRNARRKLIIDPSMKKIPMVNYVTFTLGQGGSISYPHSYSQDKQASSGNQWSESRNFRASKCPIIEE